MLIIGPIPIVLGLVGLVHYVGLFQKKYKLNRIASGGDVNSILAPAALLSLVAFPLVGLANQISFQQPIYLRAFLCVTILSSIICFALEARLIRKQKYAPLWHSTLRQNSSRKKSKTMSAVLLPVLMMSIFAFTAHAMDSFQRQELSMNNSHRTNILMLLIGDPDHYFGIAWLAGGVSAFFSVGTIYSLIQILFILKEK